MKYRIRIQITEPSKYIFYWIESKEKWYSKWVNWGGMTNGQRAIEILENLISSDLTKTNKKSI